MNTETGVVTLVFVYVVTLEILTDREPDWEAAEASLAALSDEECSKIVKEGLPEDLRFQKPTRRNSADVVLDRVRLSTALGICKTAWEENHPGITKLVGPTVTMLHCEEADDNRDSMRLLVLMETSGLAEAAGFGNLTSEMESGIRREVASFIRRSVKKYKYEAEDQVLSLASEIESGRMYP